MTQTLHWRERPLWTSRRNYSLNQASVALRPEKDDRCKLGSNCSANEAAVKTRAAGRTGVAGPEALELPVVVHPLAARRDGRDRVPGLHDLAIGDTEEIVDSGMEALFSSLAHA